MHDFMLTNKHAHAINGNFVVVGLLILGFVVLGVAAIVQLTGGVHISTGDPESFFGGEDGDPFDFPLPEEAKKGIAALLLIGALILGATLLKGRGK